jgi:hypothetical protein
LSQGQIYPHVPTPKEVDLSKQVVLLQQEKDVMEKKLLDQILDLESQLHKCVFMVLFIFLWFFFSRLNKNHSLFFLL